MPEERITAKRPGPSNQEAQFADAATVESHVLAILTKLRVGDRVQAVIFACEAGPIRPRGDRCIGC